MTDIEVPEPSEARARSPPTRQYGLWQREPNPLWGALWWLPACGKPQRASVADSRPQRQAQRKWEVYPKLPWEESSYGMQKQMQHIDRAWRIFKTHGSLVGSQFFLAWNVHPSKHLIGTGIGVETDSTTIIGRIGKIAASIATCRII